MLKYYCESCDEAVCRDCAIYEHREHVYVDLKEAVKKYRSAITSLLDRTKRKIPQLKGAVDELLEVRESLVERADLVRESIRKSIRQHIRELEDQEKELLDRLDSVHLSKEKVCAQVTGARIAETFLPSDFNLNYNYSVFRCSAREITLRKLTRKHWATTKAKESTGKKRGKYGTL